MCIYRHEIESRTKITNDRKYGMNCAHAKWKDADCIKTIYQKNESFNEYLERF